MLLFKGGNVHRGNGEVLPGTDVLVEGRTIRKIGKELTPEGAEAVDVSGKEVFPGFIIPCTSVGLVDFTDFKQGDHEETTDPITPQLHVRHALDRREVLLQQYHYTGITAFGAAPGVKNVIAGQMGVYNTAGESIKKMCIKETAAVKGNFTSDSKMAYGKRGVAPMTKMGIASLLRNAFIDAREWMGKEEKTFDEKKDVLSKVLKREIPLVMNARSAAEIQGVIEIAREFDLRLVLHNAYQPERCAESILEHGYPVMLGQPQGMGLAVGYETDFTKILEMHRSGAVICLSTSGDGGFAGRETLLWGAIRLVQAGADPEEVIPMLTLNAARALGVEEVIGSLEENKQADMVIYDGHPLKTFQAAVAYMVVAGEVVFRGTGGFKTCC